MSFHPEILGSPVEPSNLSSDLKKLWKLDASRTRASLVNLVVFCGSPSDMEPLTNDIAEIIREHACRAFLVAHGENPPSETEKPVECWINAHCHLPKAGARQVCCEQITLVTRALSLDATAGIVLSNLDYDLPLYLWWHEEFPVDARSQIWPWVDKLLFDSRDWLDPRQQLQRLHRIIDRAGTRINVSDLNWVRCLGFRRALAFTFDNPASTPLLWDLEDIRIRHSPQHKSTALLLAAWLAAQMGWKLRSTGGTTAIFETDNKPVRFTFTPSEGCPLSELVLTTFNRTELRFAARQNHPFIDASWTDLAGRCHRAEYPSIPENSVRLATEELAASHRHQVYLKALPHFQALL
jgi:glucose-6-phosphate dehydrogenase assembly protein OpcA